MMRLIALEIPDEASELAGWLEDHLAGLDLAALVAELEAVHSHGERRTRLPLALETILGKEREAVLTRGLGSLPPDRLRQLLRHPRLLLDLQELILRSARPYWQRTAASCQARFWEQRAASDRGLIWLESSGVEAAPPAIPIRTGLVQMPEPVTARGARSHWRFLGTSGVAAAAAAVLLVVFLRQQPVPNGQRPDGGGAGAGVAVAVAPSGWGWNRPDALPQDLPPKAYLDHLADGGEAWFKKRPDDKAALAKRITEFRQGCSVLIASPHKPLLAADRTWLVDKCRAWAAKLETHLADLESGQDVLKVRGEADETINKLIAALRQRAREVA